MDMIVDIIKQLGADGSLLHQFIVVVVVFYLTKFLFLDHLQAILDHREDKTVNLEGNAEKQFDEIEKIQKEYNTKLQSASKQLKEKTDQAKFTITKREEGRYRAKEEEVSSFIDDARKKLEVELAEKREKVLGEAEVLASNLVEKVTKGI